MNSELKEATEIGMPFGKYKGLKLDEIPVLYFTTLLQHQTVDPDLLKSIMTVVHWGIKDKIRELSIERSGGFVNLDMDDDFEPDPGSYDDWQDDFR